MLPEFPEWNLSWQWMAHDVICVDWPKRSRCPTMKQQTLQNCLVNWSVSARAAFNGFQWLSCFLSWINWPWTFSDYTCWFSFARPVLTRLLICSLLIILISGKALWFRHCHWTERHQRHPCPHRIHPHPLGNERYGVPVCMGSRLHLLRDFHREDPAAGESAGLGFVYCGWLI